MQQSRTIFIREGKGKVDRMVPVGERALLWCEKYLHEIRPQFDLGGHDPAFFLKSRKLLAAPSGAIRLSPDVYQEARKVAPGWDIYTLEQEWREWMADGGLDAPANPDRAFLGFCRKIFEKRGNP